jgi:Spy/CpxP family protein refolding chaperone
MRSKMVLLIMASLIAGIVGVVYVQADMDTTSSKGNMMLEKMTKKLGLTPDQQAKLKDLRTGMASRNKDTWAKIKTIREKEKQELLIPNPSQPTLYGYAKEINDLQGAIAEKRLEHLLKVKEILTPDQFKKLLDVMSNMGNRHAWKHGGHGDKEKTE